MTAIETIEDLGPAAPQVYRVLQPGGTFVITAPNRWFPVETHSFRIRGQEYRSKRWPFVSWIKPLHRRISTARNFRSSDLRRLLEPLGFQRVGINYVMPQFERRSSLGFLRTLTDRLEPTVLGTFGVSIVAAYRRPGATVRLPD